MADLKRLKGGTIVVTDEDGNVDRYRVIIGTRWLRKSNGGQHNGAVSFDLTAVVELMKDDESEVDPSTNDPSVPMIAQTPSDEL